MKYNRFLFKDYKEFQAVQDLAIQNGIKTTGEFNKFLESNYSKLNITKG